MRLAISNIAWDVVEDSAVAMLLSKHDVNAIDIAPAKYFPDPALASASDMARVRSWWGARGVQITGMQSLLFGTSGLNIFGDLQSRQLLMSHLTSVFRIAEGVGATRLVFGSPKNRDRSGLTDLETIATAVDFFGSLGDVAHSYGVRVCLEPNPSCYGANFMLNSAETADIVARVAHDSIAMQFDTGAIVINGENPYSVLEKFGSLIGHVHVSEPGLVPIGDGGADHSLLSSAVKRFLPDVVVSVEMISTKNEPHLRSIDRALSVAHQFYIGNRSL